MSAAPARLRLHGRGQLVDADDDDVAPLLAEQAAVTTEADAAEYDAFLAAEQKRAAEEEVRAHAGVCEAGRVRSAHNSTPR